jgi:very-short-patch-repair endonuclease/RimJ/RimL family protein N-acetyltransferase
MIDSLSFDDYIEVACQKCRTKASVQLVSLLKQLRRNIRTRSSVHYQCHICSKKGKLDVGVRSLSHVIDIEETTRRFGGIPSNVKKGKVVAKCEDCSSLQEVKLSSILHQARRHQASGRKCLYKCFSCGILRPDAVAKSISTRAKQLSEGFKSGLEVAMENRLKLLGLEYDWQFPLDMYAWDFFLPKYSLLIDVNGEYWHSLPENVSKDKAKLTYTNRYYPKYKTLVIQEKNFLNPLRVDKILEQTIGQVDNPTFYDFSFDSVRINQITPGKGAPFISFLDSYHYARCGRYGKIIFGAYLGDELVAVCKFNSVVRQEIPSSLGLKCNQVLELDRFCIHPSFQKKNFASWFISRCTREVFKQPSIQCLVSYADSTFGHSGTIYKAANWTEVGKTKSSYHYMDGLGIPINKKRVYDIASKLLMKEAEYAEKHNLVKFMEQPKTKFVLRRNA